MNLIKELFSRFKEHLNIVPDKENEQKVIENVRHAVDFCGVNLWILIIAVFIASIGLNIDSTPIIIGAMLISPLMGPIIGTGIAVGINDMELMKRSMRNLLTASLFAILAATVYFWISPLNEAQSELLARTSPTFYDVIIAILGGAAGFLALSTTGNHFQVIVGVAISTALLPPLCTVGFGIATGNWLYSLGAFYLFFINSVFIAISTFLSVRLFKFSTKVFADKNHERQVRRSLIVISVVTLLPSVVLTYNIVRKTIYMQNANKFIVQELDFPGTQIIDKEINYKERTIEAVFIGSYIPTMLVQDVEKRLPEYHLAGTRLQILQDGESRDSVMLSSLRGDIMKELYQKSELTSRQQKLQIDSLNEKIATIYRYDTLDSLIFNEAQILFPQIQSIALGYMWERSINIDSTVSYPQAHITSRKKYDENIEKKFIEWLRRRINAPKIQVQFVYE